MNALSSIASQLGNPSRMTMLDQLLDGRSLTASELARASNVTPQTASGHLASLVEAGLVEVSSRGRHRFFRLASPAVAELLEALFQVGADVQAVRAPRLRTGPDDERMREMRTCYNHLGGRLAVSLTDAFSARGLVELSEDGGRLTATGSRFFSALGVDEAALGPRSELVCRPCLDWSERRPHLAGRLGAAFCRRCLEADWVRRRPGTRALDVTPAGRIAFDGILRLDPERVDPEPEHAATS